MHTVTRRRPVALVTGASSGAGEAFARQLAVEGFDLIVVGSRRDRLVDLAIELEWISNAEIHVIPIDATSAEAPERVREAVEVMGLRVDVIVNGAGLCDHGPFLSIDEHRSKEGIQLDAAACVRIIACDTSATDVGSLRETSERDPRPSRTPKTPEPIAIAVRQALEHYAASAGVG
jgi:short-subunit dehydrogenase